MTERQVVRWSKGPEEVSGNTRSVSAVRVCCVVEKLMSRQGGYMVG